MSDLDELRAAIGPDERVECAVCHRRIHVEWFAQRLRDGYPRAPGGGFYCSPQCFDARPKRRFWWGR